MARPRCPCQSCRSCKTSAGFTKPRTDSGYETLLSCSRSRLRLGLSTSFVEEFFRQKTPEPLSDIFIHADHSSVIGRGLIDGYIDVACIFDNARLDPEVEQMVSQEYEEPVTWIRARNFVVSPGAPIPILTHPGNDWIIPTLTKQGLSYKIVFNTPDNHARFAAVRAGIGLTAVPTRTVPSDLVVAKEYYLPPLPPIRALLCERPGLETRRTLALVKHLCTVFFPAERRLSSSASEGGQLNEGV